MNRQYCAPGYVCGNCGCPDEPESVEIKRRNGFIGIWMLIASWAGQVYVMGWEYVVRTLQWNLLR